VGFGSGNTFVGLKDTPNGYEGLAGKLAKVKAAEDGLELALFMVHGVEQVTGSLWVDTGLGVQPANAFVCFWDDPSLDAMWCNMKYGGTPGEIVIKVWKPTGYRDCTPILSTTPTWVRWFAIVPD